MPPDSVRSPRRLLPRAEEPCQGDLPLNPAAIDSLAIGIVGLTAALVGLSSLRAAAADQAPSTDDVTAAASAARSWRRGGRLVIADPEPNTSLEPFVTSWRRYPLCALSSTLFDRTVGLVYGGYLAGIWDLAPDGRALTVTLVDHARFADGTPVDADEVRHQRTAASGRRAGVDPLQPPRHGTVHRTRTTESDRRVSRRSRCPRA